MVKLKHIKMHDTKDVPDHLIHEITSLANELGISFAAITRHKDANVVLSALNFLHAAIIKELISDNPEELQKAGEVEAITLLKNVEFLRLSMEKKNDPS